MIFVINAGSSSLKYRLFDGDTPVAGGLVERIGESGSDVPDHDAALRRASEDVGLADVALEAVGHRVVHGGSRFCAPTIVDDDVLAAIRALATLAPLHNPANAEGIAVARALRPDVPHVAVFDTAFHATLPPPAATYALDAELATRYDIRRCGAHGTSYRYVSRRAAALLGRPVEDLNMILLHLGNGASACAVTGGRSVETSMGLTPLEAALAARAVGAPWQSVAFVLLGLAQLGVAFAVRAPRRRGGPGNRGLTIAVLTSGVLQIAGVVWQPLRFLLHTDPLSVSELLACAAVAAIPGGALAVTRVVVRRATRKGTSGPAGSAGSGRPLESSSEVLVP